MPICKNRETDIFHFHNENPKGKKANDCVARAISVALSQSWGDTIKEMTDLGIKLGLVFNEDKCVEAYLKNKGWDKYKEPRDLNNKKISVAQFLKQRGNDKGVIVAKVGSHHITLIVDGVVWDTWDCTRQTMHTYYRNPSVQSPKACGNNLYETKRRFTL